MAERLTPEQEAQARAGDSVFAAGDWMVAQPLLAEIDRLREERDTFRTFVERFISEDCWGRFAEDVDGGDLQDFAVKLGILVERPHVLPCEKEPCGCDGEPVDTLYHFAWESPDAR